MEISGTDYTLITLDAETFYGTGCSLSLQSMNTFTYLEHPEFTIHGVGIKVDEAPTYWVAPDVLGEHLQALFAEAEKPVALLCHNTPFDAYILHHFWGIHPDLYLDTLAMSRGMFPNRKHGLKDLAERLWPSDPTMRKGEELIAFRNVITDELYADEEKLTAMVGYCEQDVNLTYAAFMRMFPFYPEDELEIIHLTTQMMCEPLLVLNKELLTGAREQWIADRQATIDAAGVAESTLASNPKFKALLEQNDVAIISKADLRTGAMKPALGKADLGFQQMKAANPNLHHLFDGREATKSVGEIKRADRFLATAEMTGGLMPMPLNYYSAATGRYGGSEKLNVQNMVRGSALRRALCSPPGFMVAVADSSNIEARMLAWLAGQQELLDVFEAGDDVYSFFASILYDFEVNKADHPHERFVGKTCIAEGSLVLTPRGLIPIEKISIADKIWDGVEWVSHDGLIYQGYKEVIEYGGITATADHEVYTTRSSDTVQLGVAALRMDRLVQTGLDGEAVRVGRNYLPAHREDQRVQAHESKMYPMRGGETNSPQQPANRQNQRMPKLLTAAITLVTHTRGAIRRIDSALQLANESGVQTLRRTRDTLQLCLQGRVHPLCGGELATPGLQRGGNRPDRQQRALRAWEPSTSYPAGAEPQQGEHAPYHVARPLDPSARVPLTVQHGPHLSIPQPRNDGGGNSSPGLGSRGAQTQELAGATREAHVYDIANAGPRQRFTVDGKLVHNCVLGLGYGQGWRRFKDGMAAGMLGGDPVLFTDAEAQNVVNTYRTTNYMITQYWKEAEQAIIDMLMGNDHDWGVLKITRNAIIMPNGMALQYPGLRQDDEGGFEYHNGRFWTRLYGAKLVENITQALSRIVLFDQMLKINRYVVQDGGRVVLNVHDEVIAVVPEETVEKDFEQMLHIMRQPPAWCATLPLDAEGGWDTSYSK